MNRISLLLVLLLAPSSYAVDVSVYAKCQIGPKDEVPRALIGAQLTINWATPHDHTTLELRNGAKIPLALIEAEAPYGYWKVANTEDSKVAAALERLGLGYLADAKFQSYWYDNKGWISYPIPSGSITCKWSSFSQR
jgi:hypothetical protein